MKKTTLPLLLTLFLFGTVKSQDEDLLSLLGDEESVEYVTGAFKTNRVINSHSIESTFGGVLDVKISHRFGRLNSGFFQFYGLDDAMVRIGLDYGVSDAITIGFGRSSFDKVYDGFIKYKFLRQSIGLKEMGISAAILYNFGLLATETNPDPEDEFSSRFSHTTQLIIGRKFSENLSLQIMPTFLHRNLVDFDEKNQIVAFGFAGRQKITKRLALTAEYYYVPDTSLPDDYHNSLSVGIDIETGGHVFQLHFTNSTSMVHGGFISRTDGKWSDGDIHFGFNIARVFTIKRPKLE